MPIADRVSDILVPWGSQLGGGHISEGVRRYLLLHAKAGVAGPTNFNPFILPIGFAPGNSLPYLEVQRRPRPSD